MITELKISLSVIFFILIALNLNHNEKINNIPDRIECRIDTLRTEQKETKLLIDSTHEELKQLRI